MYELDHMLDGEASRQRHQDIIREVQRERYANKVAARRNTTAQNHRGIVGQIRAALTNIITTVLG